jgi:hypothetical protein
MLPPLHRNARSGPLVVLLKPVTVVPEALIPSPTDDVPPSVPK